jgi:hypothetical protein
MPLLAPAISVVAVSLAYYCIQNRELQIMKLLSHPNVVALRNSFYTTGEKV